MSHTDDELVSEYLRRLESVAAVLPADRRRELIDEITAHIADARASMPTDPGGVRTILDQLGSPEDIVRAAGANLGSGDEQPPDPRAGKRGSPGALEVVTVIALLVGGLVIPVIGWVVGVVLLWVSDSWRTRDKLLATLVWPGGLLAPLVVFAALGAVAFVPLGPECSVTASPISSVTGQAGKIYTHSCTSGPVPSWLAIALAILVVLASIAGPIYVAMRLLRRARRPEATFIQPAQSPLMSSMPA